MSEFEKLYYEAPRFWEEGALEDEFNLARINQTIDLIPADTNSLLDAGCGNGIFLNTLVRVKPHINSFGFDRSEEALKYVKVPHAVGDMDKLNFDSRSFDCVSSLEVIEHLPIEVYKNALREIARVAGKYIVISVPYNENLEENSNQCPSCKTIFNADLHMRSFTLETFRSLFDSLGFSCRKHLLAGEVKTYKYHYSYRRLFYPNQFRAWRSPVCPICGYMEDFNKKEEPAAPVTPVVVNGLGQTSLRSMLFGLPKKLWPKETKYTWILGLFERS